jgi:hypothetical protein
MSYVGVMYCTVTHSDLLPAGHTFWTQGGSAQHHIGEIDIDLDLCQVLILGCNNQGSNRALVLAFVGTVYIHNSVIKIILGIPDHQMSENFRNEENLKRISFMIIAEKYVEIIIVHIKSE